ncbi:hypothetical protein RSAG8_08220, partial [Rhizoctonia solani AG-8 WAC10335]
MLCESTGNISTDSIQAALASLTDAADALAKAAATFVAAAQATSKAFSKELPPPASPEESHGINLGRGSDTASEKVSGDQGDSNLRPDADTGDGEDAHSISASAEDRIDLRPMNIDTPKHSEADVLLFLCSLVDRRQKVVCYMPCGTPALKTYKRLVEKVTESAIYILNSSDSLKQDRAYVGFLENQGSVLLVPEALLPQFEIEGENSWVIHVGWPASETRYTAQRGIHRAQNIVTKSPETDLGHCNHWHQVEAAVSRRMLCESTGNISTDSIQAALASLTDAADALAKAAATFVAAAQATSKAFSKELPPPSSPEENHGIINLGRGSDTASEKVSGDQGDSNLRPDADTGDGEDAHSISASAEDRIDLRLMNTDTPKHSEADVLLFLCSLVDRRQKVVCYMPCGTPALKTYKRLVEKVTESAIYILNSSDSLKQDRAYVGFLENQGSVLLVPEALLPQFEIEGENSWVIHVGWPASETRYTAQRGIHRAQNNILVAYSGDQSLYPSGDTIVELTETWPKDGAPFRASVSILRPLYEVMLSEISFEMKSEVYLDWIQCHGIHGPRHVEAWTASMVVQRANAYLTEVLHWSGEHTGSDNIPLPEVSLGFVTQNDLQTAVQEGIL